MKCTEKERETCEYEKLGCKGCFYNETEADEVLKETVVKENNNDRYRKNI